MHHLDYSICVHENGCLEGFDHFCIVFDANYAFIVLCI